MQRLPVSISQSISSLAAELLDGLCSPVVVVCLPHIFISLSGCNFIKTAVLRDRSHITSAARGGEGVWNSDGCWRRGRGVWNLLTSANLPEFWLTQVKIYHVIQVYVPRVCRISSFGAVGVILIRWFYNYDATKQAGPDIPRLQSVTWYIDEARLASKPRRQFGS